MRRGQPMKEQNFPNLPFEVDQENTHSHRSKYLSPKEYIIYQMTVKNPVLGKLNFPIISFVFVAQM